MLYNISYKKGGQPIAPKQKITGDMIIDAAFEITRNAGIEGVNARSIAQKLGCSTQPILYHFAKIDDIKRAVYAKADSFHTDFLLQSREPAEDFMLGIGLNYIRFAIAEPHLFHFLFQSGYAAENSLLEMIDSPMLAPVLSAMQQTLGCGAQQTKDIFVTIALFAHGYASIIANNSLAYDEALVSAHLERAYYGAILAAQEEKHEYFSAKNI